MEEDFIDTSIFLQVYLPQNKKTKKYTKGCLFVLERLDKLYKGHISIAVLGELFFILLDNVNKGKIDFRVLEEINEKYIKKAKTIEIKPTTLKLAHDISENFRVEPFDALHIATAIDNKISIFFTIDEKIFENEKLTEYSKKEGTTIKLIKILN